MKSIYFKNPSIKNFLSIGKTEFTLPIRPGLFFITGQNFDKDDSRNGVGKSTIGDFFHWILFGDPIREITKDRIVNNQTKKDCVGILPFDIQENGQITHYKIVRMLEPNKLFLYKNDEDITLSSIPKTTDQIINLLGFNSTVCQHSMLMSLNNTLPFMAQKKVDKRKFIEGIFNLNVLSEMLLLVRQDYNDLKKECEQKQNSITELTNLITTYKEKQQSSQTNKQTKLQTLTDRIKGCNTSIDGLTKQFHTIDAKIEDGLKLLLKKVNKQINDCDKELETFNKNTTQITININICESQINKLQNVFDKQIECPTCKKPFTKDDKDKIDAEVVRLNDTIKTNKDAILNEQNNISKKKLEKKNIEKQKESIEKQLATFDTQRIENNFLLKQIDQYNKQIEDTKKDIENLNKEDDDFQTLINQQETKLKKIQDQIAEDTLKLKDLDVVKFIVSEEGVKSFIVKKLLELLNFKLNHYLQRLDANCKCIFNEYFEETIVNERGFECSYHNFSGGERKRIDLAMIFAFKDLQQLQGNVWCNISIYDELLDSALDQKGKELVLEILKERVEKYKECIYIIGHNINIFKTPIDGTLFLEKRNGFTRLVKGI